GRRRLIALRKRHPAFKRTRFLEGRGDGGGLPDVWWFRPDGRRITIRDWDSPESRYLGVCRHGGGMRAMTPGGEPEHDDSFLLMFNAHFEPVRFRVPARRFGTRWVLELSTAEPQREAGASRFA